MPSELQSYDYVNQPYETVRRRILEDPAELFRHATSTGNSSRLHVRFGALELGADIVVEIRGVDEQRDPRSQTTLEIEWRSRRGAALFPIMTARFAIYPLTPTETQLQLDGTYDPPLGVVGQAIDAVAMHRVARSSAEEFIREVAAFLRRTLTTAPALT